MDFRSEGFMLYGIEPATLSVDISPEDGNEVRIWLLNDHLIGERCQSSILPMLEKYCMLQDVAKRIGGNPIPEDPLWGEPWVWRWYLGMTVEQIVAFLEEKLHCKLVRPAKKEG